MSVALSGKERVPLRRFASTSKHLKTIKPITINRNSRRARALRLQAQTIGLLRLSLFSIIGKRNILSHLSEPINVVFSKLDAPRFFANINVNLKRSQTLPWRPSRFRRGYRRNELVNHRDRVKQITGMTYGKTSGILRSITRSSDLNSIKERD